MKSYPLISAVVVSVLLSFFCVNTVNAQAEINPRIQTAIKTGSAKDLSVFFNNPIDLTTPGNEGTYSKSQAEMILRGFFQKYPPASFSISHHGKSNDGSQYAIGSYRSGSNVFRTYFLLKVIGGQPLIHQLKFETDED
ncbi:MAG: DUF4783 domain-containing protein [Bacteroidales bacterium]|nr:DUF4783 domain-containing protein [Bacteroidales bacterium]